MAKNSPKVFISHASEDKLFVLDLAKKLREKGVDAWVDHWEMLPGDKLVDKIFEEGIKNADTVIIVLSKQSVDKPWVREELDAAFVRRVENKIKLIPVIIEKCDVPAALHSTVWENIKDINNYELEFTRILNAIFGISEKPEIGEVSPYPNPITLITGLTPQDTLVMCSICEKSIKLNKNWIGIVDIKEALTKDGISEEAIRESLEILKDHHYLQGTPEGLDYFEITWIGFHSYAEAYISGFNDTVQNILVAIINNNLSTNVKISDEFKLSLTNTNYILDILSNVGYLQIDKLFGGEIKVTGITASGKRAARGESLFLKIRKSPEAITSRVIFKANSSVYALAVSPTQDVIAAGTYQGVIECCYLTDQGKNQSIIVSDKPIHALKFSYNGELLASAGEDDMISIIHWTTKEIIYRLKGHTATVTSLAFSPDGNRLVSGSRDKSIKIWELSSGKFLRDYSIHQQSVYSVDWSKDGAWIASGSSDCTVRIISVSNPDEIFVLGKTTGTILSVAFSPRGNILASGQWGGSIRLWDVTDKKSLKKLEGHSSKVYSLAFSPISDLLISGSNDMTIRFWKIPEGINVLPAQNAHINIVRGLSFAPTGDFFVSSDTNGEIRLWNLNINI